MHTSAIKPAGARGFTLIEVLVSLVVLSIGLLGLAALQLTSLKANHGSSTRTQAVYLAYDIIDRMRANPTDVFAHNYDTAIGAVPTGGTVSGNDLVAWKQAIVNALPRGDIIGDGMPHNPDGSVTFNAATNLVTVSVVWNDSHADINSTNHTFDINDVVTFSMTTQLFN
jgi:type IV pilus assembly protein PilV